MPPETDPQTETRDVPMMMRPAPISSIDEAARTVNVMWSTGAAVRRMGWDGPYDEILSMDPAHVDLGRLSSGTAPALNVHSSSDLRDVIGVVERSAIANGKGTATIRFSRRADVEPIWQDVKDGIIRNISVGYLTRKVEIDRSVNPPVYRAVDWEPRELSFVPIGAEQGAGTRADASSPTASCLFVTLPRADAQNRKDVTMPPEVTTGAVPGAETTEQRTVPTSVPAAPSPTPVTEQQSESVAGTAPRAASAADIRAAVAAVHLPETTALDLLERNLTIDQARAAIFDILATASDRAPIRSHVAEVTRDEQVTRRDAVAEALLHRYQPSAYPLTDLGREYRGMSLIEIGRSLVESRGAVTRGLGRDELAALTMGLDTRSGGMMSTSDFPAILANVANKTLRRAYEESPRTFLPFCRETTLTDFKPVSRTQLSGAPDLKPINEQGEYTRGSLSDGKETYQLATYGRIVAIDRRAIINDDLDAFTRIPFLAGKAAARMECNIVWAVITGNPAMGDGNTLFDATNHGNVVGTASAIGIAGLSSARALMRLQKGLAGELLNLAPKYILVPAALETLANQYTSLAYVSTKSADINTFAGTLTPIVEPRLDAASMTAWYLAADPGEIDTIEYAYLDGQQGVYLESRVGFDVDGIEIKIREDFATKAIDWRGFVKNAGV